MTFSLFLSLSSHLHLSSHVCLSLFSSSSLFTRLSLFLSSSFIFISLGLSLFSSLPLFSLGLSLFIFIFLLASIPHCISPEKSDLTHVPECVSRGPFVDWRIARSVWNKVYLLRPRGTWKKGTCAGHGDVLVVLLWCGVCCGVVCVVVWCGVVWCVLCGLRLPSKRFVVAPAVFPRMFEILAALTFGALRKKTHLCHQHSRTSHKKEKTMKTRRPRVVSNVS